MTAPAFRTSDNLKPLPSDPARLTGPSERIIRSHRESNCGGSGRVALGFNVRTRRLESDGMVDRAHGPAGTLPVLVMGRYEHSHPRDCGAAAAKYIDAFSQAINWECVAARPSEVGAATS